MPSQCIVLTDGETRAALAAARSLGRAGHRIHTTCSRTRTLTGASRYCFEEHLLPSAELAPDSWTDALDRLCERVGADWVLPTTELSMGTIFAAGLHERRAVLAPSAGAYHLATDKYAILSNARESGIHVPRTLLVEDPRTLDVLPPGFTFPAVLKARRSRFRVEGHWRSGGVVTVRNSEELRKSARDPGFAEGVLVQEFVPGHGEAIFLLASQGECLATFAHRRIREKPPSGGVSVLRESIEADPALLAGSIRLLAKLRFNGAAMVEFRRAPDGTAALMEINPRLWGSLQLAIDADVDFPTLLLRMHDQHPVVAPSARIGVRSRWLLGDLDHLLICLRRPEMREATSRTRRTVVADFVRSFRDGSNLEVLMRDDWRPFCRELIQWISRRD